MNLKKNKTLISIVVVILSIILVGGGYLFVKKACVEDIKEKYKEEIEALKEIADFEKIDCNPFTRSVEISNIKAKDGSFSVKTLILSNYKEDKELKVPISLSMKFKGFKTKNEGKVYKGDINIFYNLDLKNEKLKLDTDIHIKDEGVYKISFLFGNVSKDKIKILNNIAQNSKSLNNQNINENLDFIMALGSMNIEKVYFGIIDEGLVNKVLKKVADEKGSTVDDVKREVIADINRALKEENLSESDKRLFTVFKELIEGKRKKIAFTIERKEGTDTSIMKILTLMTLSPEPLQELKKMFKIEVD